MGSEQISPTDIGQKTDLEVIDRYLSIDGRFLVEAGCGNMHLSKELASRGAVVLAIDPDPIQAAKNKQAETIANVGFAEAGADALPVERSQTDGILFPYSLHHIPRDLLGKVFDEAHRVLKDDGFVYVMEPVAAGALNDIMSLFHDEFEVRKSAQQALDEIAIPGFKKTTVVTYHYSVSYKSWEHFVSSYAGKSYNTNYSEEQVRDARVREAFEDIGGPLGYTFDSPMRVTYLQGPIRDTPPA